MSFDYRSELEKSVKARDAKGSIACVSDMLSFVLEAFNEAARLGDNLTALEMIDCYEKFSLDCSGALMEDLLAKDNIALAAYFITSGKWWGTANKQYEDFMKERSKAGHSPSTL